LEAMTAVALAPCANPERIASDTVEQPSVIVEGAVNQSRTIASRTSSTETVAKVLA
jgi:hypothetical protein